VIIKLGPYRSNTKFVEHCYNNRRHKNLDKLGTEIAVALNVPCLVIFHFLKEIAGDSPEIQAAIVSITKQYNYEGVIE
jgi:BioD-like phosphotransacetylase family protein